MPTDSYIYTGAEETWVVPPGVRSIVVDMAGGSGGSESGSRAPGGRVQCRLAVTPGDTLYLYVGGTGTTSASSTNPGGFPRGGVAYNGAGSGGGLSAVVEGGPLAIGTVLAVAGGGGGRSGTPSFAGGGAGGGTTGAAGTTDGTAGGGGGGTPSAGGAAGAGGGTGNVPAGAGEADGRHNGGTGGRRVGFARDGGGGGGGWYGGGGGGAQTGSSSAPRAGGGGGSSYVDPTVGSAVIHTQGYQDGNGYIVVTYRPAGRRGLGMVR